MPHSFIAVIDDDEPFRTALLESLSSLGYRADGFATGEEFLGRSASAPYDCIVTDFHMPGMSGLELTEQLAARCSPTPVVLITARSETGISEKGRAAGAVCLLTKPFELDELVGCLVTAIVRSAR